MEHQGFDPTEKTTLEVAEFTEQIEAAEDFEPESEPSAKQSGSMKKKKRKSGSNNNKKALEEPLRCLFRGQSSSHSASDCTKLKERAKASQDQARWQFLQEGLLLQVQERDLVPQGQGWRNAR